MLQGRPAAAGGVGVPGSLWLLSRFDGTAVRAFQALAGSLTALLAPGTLRGRALRTRRRAAWAKSPSRITEALPQ